MRIYQEYLAERACKEEWREKELDTLVNAEVEKNWAKWLAGTVEEGEGHMQKAHEGCS